MLNHLTSYIVSYLSYIFSFPFFFNRYFDWIDICKVRPDWFETRISGKLPHEGERPPKVVKITLPSTTEIEVGVFQESLR